MNRIVVVWRSVSRLFALFMFGFMVWTLAKFFWVVANAGGGVDLGLQWFYLTAAGLLLLMCVQNIVDTVLNVWGMNASAWRRKRKGSEPETPPEDLEWLR